MDELPLLNRHVMPELRDKAYRRLASIEGQIKGLKKMLEEERPCLDILIQLAAAQEAMRGVTKLLMRNYLERCATEGIQSGDPEKLRATYDEIMDVFFKLTR